MVLVVVALLAGSCSALGPDDSQTANPQIGSTSEPIVSPDDETEEPAAPTGTNPTGPVWSRADDTAPQPDQPTVELAAVAPPDGDGLWRIVGSEYDHRLDRYVPVVWEAQDVGGFDPWTRTDIDPGPLDDAALLDVARIGGQDVAVGSQGRESEERPAVWVRDEESDWRLVDESAIDGDREGFLHDVMAGPTGEGLAVGSIRSDAGVFVPMLWQSDDGLAWQQLPDTPFADDGSLRLRDAVLGPDRLVATGVRVVDGITDIPTAWWSETGTTWSEADVEVPAGAAEGVLNQAVWFDGAYVAVGGLSFDGSFRPAAWTSTDGTSWQLASDLFDTIDSGSRTNFGFAAFGLTVAGDRLLATAAEAAFQHVWSSSDGSTWTPVDDILARRPGGVRVQSLAGSDDEIVVATPEPGLLTYNERWTETELRVETFPSPQAIPFVDDVVATPDGWLAVGGQSLRIAGQDRTNRGAAWTSVDGVTWTEVTRLPGSTLCPVSIATAAGDRVVAAGTETLDGARRNNRLGASRIWSFDGVFDNIQASGLFDNNSRISIHSIGLAGEAILGGGWTFSGNDPDAFLIDSQAGLDRRIDLGHNGPDDEQVNAICGREDGTAAALTIIQNQQGNLSIAASVRSTDGVWTDASFPARPAEIDRAFVDDCVFGSGEILAVGWTAESSNLNNAIWRSEDGQGWESIEPPADVDDATDQWLSGIVALDNSYLLVGVDRSSGQLLPMVWHGDGTQWSGVHVTGGSDDSTAGMDSLELAVRGQDVTVIGRKNGVERIYTTTLERLTAEQ